MTEDRLIVRILLSAVVGIASHPSAAADKVVHPPDMSRRILTVRGPIDPSDLGPTMMHEHVFLDYSGGNRRRERATELSLWNEPVSLKTLSLLRVNPELSRDNLLLTDMDLAISEILEFKKWGGKSIVDVTSYGLGADPQALFHLSNATGINVIMGTGFYVHDFHPPDMEQRTVEELAGLIIRDVAVGVNGTGIRSGIIGEVGVSPTPTANEEKSIRASARASRATGVAISFHHAGQGEMKFRTLGIVASEGVAMNRVIIGHANHIANDVPFMKRLLERGVYIEFDLFGEVIPRLGRVHDYETVRGIVALIQAGYDDRILISQDVCTKTMLRAYGGTGYSYVMEFVLPQLRALGVTDEQIGKILVENPKRVLTFVAPAR